MSEQSITLNFEPPNPDQWRVMLLNSAHNRAAFDCGVEEMNRYLQQQAGQNARQNVSRTYVAATSSAPAEIGGYYTLTLRSVGFQELPKEKRLPRYPIPLVHLGRLAVALNQQGKTLGKLLLLDALDRAVEISDQAGGYAVEVAALDPQAAQFYAKYRFVPVDGNDPLHLYLTMQTIRNTRP